MSQIQELPKFDKIWKMFDHCIENKVFTQIKGSFRDDICGRCADGVIGSYLSNNTLMNANGFYKGLEVLTGGKIKFVRDMVKRKELWVYGIRFNKHEHPEKIREMMKEMYEKEGFIEASFIAVLNDGYIYRKGSLEDVPFSWTFEDFRDFFKELDI